jgi:hypothetical protein
MALYSKSISMDIIASSVQKTEAEVQVVIEKNSSAK